MKSITTLRTTTMEIPLSGLFVSCPPWWFSSDGAGEKQEYTAPDGTDAYV